MTRVSLLVLFSFFVSACSITGLPGDQLVSELTDEDAKQACEAFYELTENAYTDEEEKALACNISGMNTALLVASINDSDFSSGQCEEGVELCLENYEDNLKENPKETIEEACGDIKAEQYSLTKCSATIAEWEECTKASLDHMKKYFVTEFTCDEDLGEKTNVRTAVEECKTFYESCE